MPQEPKLRLGRDKIGRKRLLRVQNSIGLPTSSRIMPIIARDDWDNRIKPATQIGQLRTREIWQDVAQMTRDAPPLPFRDDKGLQSDSINLEAMEKAVGGFDNPNINPSDLAFVHAHLRAQLDKQHVMPHLDKLDEQMQDVALAMPKDTNNEEMKYRRSLLARQLLAYRRLYRNRYVTSGLPDFENPEWRKGVTIMRSYADMTPVKLVGNAMHKAGKATYGLARDGTKRQAKDIARGVRKIANKSGYVLKRTATGVKRWVATNPQKAAIGAAGLVGGAAGAYAGLKGSQGVARVAGQVLGAAVSSSKAAGAISAAPKFVNKVANAITDEANRRTNKPAMAIAGIAGLLASAAIANKIAMALERKQVKQQNSKSLDSLAGTTIPLGRVVDKKV